METAFPQNFRTRQLGEITVFFAVEARTIKFSGNLFGNEGNNNKCHYNQAAKKMKFSIKDFFSKCDQICSFLRIWSHLPKKSFMENFIFCAVLLSHQTIPNPTSLCGWYLFYFVNIFDSFDPFLTAIVLFAHNTILILFHICSHIYFPNEFIWYHIDPIFTCHSHVY